MRAFALAAASMMATPALAQDPQAWSQMQVTVGVAEGWKAGAELSGRTVANERAEQVLLRVHAARVLSDRATLWLGYVRAETLNGDRRNGLEQRATGQLDWNVATLGRFRLASRTRIEARYFRGSDEGPSWRVREQVRLLLPLRGATVSAGVEPFLALNRTANASRTLEQLRLTANVVVPLTDTVELDIGYNHQRLFRADGNVLNHVIPVTVRIDI